MNQPIDLVRATLEQAWQADRAGDIYLAQQVVNLRGLLAAAHARIEAVRLLCESHQASAAAVGQGDRAVVSPHAVLAVLDSISPADGPRL